MTLLDEIGGIHAKVLNPSGGCTVCPHRFTKITEFVPATLRQGKILWLGEAPGATEVEEQEGFTGKSGELLRRTAREYAVPEPWSFSNTIHCRPPDNDTPTPEAISCCLRQFVLDEIRGYPIVVMCGATPLRALFPGANADHFRGNVAYHPDFPGQRFYAMYHPAYMFRRGDLKPQYEKQMARLGKIARGEEGPQPWTILRGNKGVEALKKMVLGPMLSFDLETTSVKSWEVGAKIRSFCCTGDAKTVVALSEEDAGFLAGLELLKWFLEQPEKGVVGANVAFDVEFMERDMEFEAKCHGIHDAAIWWYEAGQHKQVSLKQLVAEELDGYRYLVYQPHLERDTTLLLNYNAEDVVYALQLVLKAVQKVGPQTADLVNRVLGPASLIYRRAQAKGLYLRADYRKKKIEEYEEKRRQAVASWKDEDPEFIPKTHESGKGLIKYLFTVRQLPVLGETAKGQPVTDKAVIKQYVRDGHTYLRHLLTIKEVDKLMGTFLKAYDEHVDVNSRIHPRFWLTSTDTSRPSSSDPNVFNIPRNREIRDLFGVPAGAALVESDLSQIEFRIMVCLAKDENGIAAYLRGEDAHTMTAKTISGNPTPTKEQRNQAKPVNFANLYGATPYTAQQVALNDYGVSWTDQQAAEFQRQFFQTYPRIPEFHEAARRRLIANRGWFESITGHRWHYEDWDHEDKGRSDHAYRAALNAEAQGPAANICFYIAILARRILVERGFGTCGFVNSVYDSIMTEVPNPKWVPDVIGTINEAAQQVHGWVKHWFIVPLLMDHKHGESWGSLKDWK